MVTRDATAETEEDDASVEEGHPGLSWSPERTKTAAADLLDVFPHTGEVGGRDNEGEVVVTAHTSEVEFA